MIDHIWSIICSGSSIDSESNNVTIYNILEQLSINTPPKEDGIIRISFEIISLWARKISDKPVQGQELIQLKDPNDNILGSIEVNIDLQKSERHHIRLRINGLPARMSGRHHFSIDYKVEGDDVWHNAAEIPLWIYFSSQEPKEENKITI